MRFALPYGRALLVAAGVVVLAMCGRRRPGRPACGQGARRAPAAPSRSLPGRALVLLAVAGFLVFGVYSLLEARYRQVTSGV